MFRRVVTEHWQAVLAGALLLLTLVAMLLQYLAARRVRRDTAERLARLPLENDAPPRHDAQS